MSITVSGHKDHNGFLLSKPFTHHGKIFVLTGRNGSGKTRLLESIQKQLCFVEVDGEKLESQEIMFVGQAALTPSFGGAYNDAEFQSRLTSSLQFFDRVKKELDVPLDLKVARDRWRGQEAGLPYEALHMMCQSMSKNLGKPASTLTHEEIKLHFEDYVQSVLGFQNISSICNNYIKRKNQNEYNRFRAEQKGKDVIFFSDEDFFRTFGREPWVLLNEIIRTTFDNKFYFTEPDVKSESYSYNATLIQSDSGAAVTVNVLSSGEKTLLWLALTLFNSQYYERKLVKAPKLLLLDEPDAFLHPKMVEKMYRSLSAFASSFDARVGLTTHSPTTVALSPENSTYIVSNNSITPVSKDEGIAELLDGITQISINPENRRQVYVESQYDADVYQAIYTKLLGLTNALDPKISISFISSGPKMPRQQLIDKARQILNVCDESLLNEFVVALNGVGNSVQVIGQVEALESGDNRTVRGIVDWDKKNKPSGSVSVLAEEYAYSIENITLDPVCILLLLHTDKPELFSMQSICGADVHWSKWIDDEVLLQESVDRFIERVIGRKSRRDAKIEYVSGVALLTDSEYLLYDGHSLEALVKQKYEALKSFARSGKDGELKYSVVRRSMINLANGKFIPNAFEKVISFVQK